MIKYLFAAISFLLFTCTAPPKQTNNDEKPIKTDSLLYAENFAISKYENYTKLSVFNPWQGAENIEFSYYLSQNSEQVELSNNTQFIKIPVKKVVVLSTTHIGLLESIGEADKIVGASGLNFVCNKTVLKNQKNNKVHNVGYGVNLNYELLLRLKPDVIFVYGVNAETQTQINKLKDLGLKPVIIAEYLEKTPLAQAEWIKFMATFFNKQKETKHKFIEISNTYNNLKQRVENLKQKPVVMANLPYKGVWYVAGGNSFPAQLISDAGGDYVWKNIKKREAVPMNIEKVISTTQNADFWINSGFANSLQDITSVDERTGEIKAFKEQKVFNNNKIQSEFGGNAYFESGTANPHLLLKDLISILHPTNLPEHELVFYKQLK